MNRARKIHPLQIAILVILLVLLPLGMFTLTAVLGATPLPWLSMNGGQSASDADTAQIASEAEPVDAPSASDRERLLRADYVATAPTPELIFLPLVSQ